MVETDNWWSRGGSNSWPPHCERGALPTELLPHGRKNTVSGFRFQAGTKPTLVLSTLILVCRTCVEWCSAKGQRPENLEGRSIRNLLSRLSNCLVKLFYILTAALSQFGLATAAAVDHGACIAHQFAHVSRRVD